MKHKCKKCHDIWDCHDECGFSTLTNTCDSCDLIRE